MIYRQLSFEGFMSYRRQQIVPLAGLGFVVVQGRNEVSGAADSNGAGKTSLWHALSYVQFGQTLDGRRGDDVACRFTSDSCLTTLALTDEQGDWTITRGRRPKVLRVTGFPGMTGLEDDKVIQAAIESRLRFGYLTFRNAVVFAQGRFERFAQADQASQMQMLDEIQGLDLTHALAKAKAWRDSIESDLASKQRQIGTLESLHTDRCRQRDELVASRKSFKADKDERIEHRERELVQVGALLRKTLERLAEFKAKEYTLAEARVKWKKAQELLAAIQSVFKLTSELPSELSYCDDIAEEENRLKLPATCPTCLGTIDKKKLEGLVKVRVKSLRLYAVKNAETRTELARKAADLQGQFQELDVTERSLASLEAECSTGLAAARQAKSSQEQAVKDARTRLTEERDRCWTGEALLTRLEKDLDEGAAEISRLVATADRLSRSLKLAAYWVEAFGDRGIRSLMVDSVAGFLGQRMIYHLNQLAAGEASMQLSAVRQLKGGGQRERLTIGTEWTWGGKDVGSNGQDRRIDLALFAALQDLAESQSTRPFPLKVWDEPGDALDSRGRELFVEWVSAEARRRGSGFLTTHAQELTALVVPDQLWTVVLDTNGSRIEIE